MATVQLKRKELSDVLDEFFNRYNKERDLVLKKLEEKYEKEKKSHEETFDKSFLYRLFYKKEFKDKKQYIYDYFEDMYTFFTHEWYMYFDEYDRYKLARRLKILLLETKVQHVTLSVEEYNSLRRF